MSRSSTTVGVFLVLATNVLTWPLELWTARRVWDANSNLRKSRGTSQGAVVTETSDLSHHGQGQQASSVGLRMKASALTCFSSSCAWLIEYRISLQEYFTTDIYLPSLATSGLHFSILNYSSTFTVFLLNSHFSLTFITLAETLSAFFELASTFLFPWAVHTLSLSKQHYARVPDGSALSTAIPLSPTGHLRSIPSSPVDARFPSGSRGPSTSNDEQELERAEDPDPSANISSGLSRLGLLALLQMLLSLVSPSHRPPPPSTHPHQLPALPALWHLSTNLPPQPPTPTQSSPWHTHPLPTTLLLLCVSASRFGRWTTVLSTQQLAQTLVPARQRSSFAGTEAGFASLFGLAHWLATAVWSQRRDFRWLALGSVGGVVGSTCVWGYWLGRRRVEGRG
ncbi:hypothetical protein MMC13_001964 [Lambiella insularis]|nr:hypothetical protein [Lambiella insularis]